MGRPRKHGITITRAQVLAKTEEPGTRARLSYAINRIVEERGLTQTEAARIVGVHQTTMSNLRGYNLERFSVERLMRFLTALGQDVEIEIRPATKDKGRVRVVGAA